LIRTAAVQKRAVPGVRDSLDCHATLMEEKTMAKTKQISVFLPNTPGELLKLCDYLKGENANILAISIQNARDYVEELFKARERTGRRIVLEESYRGVLRESSDYSVIRLVVEQPEKAEKILRSAEYTVDIEPVICLTLKNKPGALGEVAGKFAQANINIDYVYGSVMEDAKESLFVVHIPDIEKGLGLFED
jgi:hypothetical protein